MNPTFKTLVMFLAFCAATAPAQTAGSASPLTSLVNTEFSFARTSAQKGMDSAFMAFLSDEAIVFRPHPVNGQEWFRTHPAPPILLTWAPGFADVSVTGDLGYTTGPWIARDRADTTAPPAYGDFVTVWKKDGGNAWKVELDMGISHPAPASGVQFTSPTNVSGRSSLVRPDSGFRAAAWSKLLAREHAAFGDSLRAVPVMNFLPLLSSAARMFRPGRFPIVGDDSVRAFFDSEPGKFFRHSLGGDLSGGGDLGYTYGGYRFVGKDAKDETEGYYLTIWKREGKGNWNIVLDIQSILPKKGK